MNGVVPGGWSFVWAAYAVSATILVAYSIHAISDFRRSMKTRAALTRSTKGVSA
jgi:heme exporter protein D